MISFVEMLLIVFTSILFVLYSSLIIYYWFGWRSFPDFLIAGGAKSTGLSVIIPARNEENNIGRLLQSLHAQHYPKDLVELIVVDDHSTDRTAEIVRQFPAVKLLSLGTEAINSFKKKAIEEGITAAKYPTIITTDADCSPGPGWLSTIIAFKQENKSSFVAAPVRYLVEEKNFLAVFQALDFLVLQGITAVSVRNKLFAMCNGANLAYDKTAFYQVDGFKTIDKLASGDDMFLMQKIKRKFPDAVHYLKSKAAIVETEAAKTWKEFFHQRLRWASKARHYEDGSIFAVQLLVFFLNLCFFALLIAAIWRHDFIFWAMGLWIGKTVIEFPFVHSVASWFGQRFLLNWFFFFQPFHMAYTVVVGTAAQFVKYEWKGRKVK